MQAIILAGGKGTRLKELTAEIPKPMVKVGDRPIIEHQVRLLKQYGIKNIKLIVNHLSEPLVEHLKDGSTFGVNITYYQEKEPLGTSGAFPLIVDELEDTFMVVYGDVMFDMDIRRLIDFHQRNDADATLVIHPNDHPYDSDLVEVNSENKIINFHSKPHEPGVYLKNMVNAGVYIFNKKVIDHLPGAIKSDFGKDIFPQWIHELNVYGYNTPEYLKDMGTLDRLSKVTEDLTSGKINRRNLKNKQKAIFLDRDGVLNEDRHLIHKPEDLVLYEGTAEAIKKINNSDFLSIVATNQSVVARNLCTIEELAYIHKKLDSDLGADGAKLDHLYYCPYHPDKGYPEENPLYKKEHPWRKPNPGMLLQGAEDFNVDLSQSYMIGDRASDIHAGKNAGCTTVAVRTGHGYKNAKTEPDFFFDNLNDAVNFIIDDPLLATCQEIHRQLNFESKERKIILIGGNTQSGKSTLARRLAKFFDEKSIDNKVIALDHFLLQQPERKTAKNVFERFQIKNTIDLIESLLKGDPIEIRSYNKHPKAIGEDLHFKLTGEKVIIIEGIVALADATLRSRSDLNIYMDQPFERYKERFYDLYQWKDYTMSEIDNLFADRVIDEFTPIKDTREFADLIINTI